MSAAPVHVPDLPVKAAAEYCGNFPKFSQPKEVAWFSRDASRAVTFDRSSLRKYKPARLPAELDVDFESYVPRATSGNGGASLSDVLGACSNRGVALRDVQIVTFRNNLNKIFATPYNPSDGWEVGVERRDDGVVLLNVRETARKQAEEAARSEQEQRMCYWGYRFEHLSTLSEPESGNVGASKRTDGYRVPSPSDSGSYEHLYPTIEVAALHKRYGGSDSAGDGGPRPVNSGPGPVNANEEFCSIVQLTIDKVKLLMAAEIDCTADKAGDVARGGAVAPGYVELKTSKAHASPRDTQNFEKHKLLKFWLQSFLGGVPSVVVGFRDATGVVRELKTYETKTIHRIVRPHGYWDPTACFNFGRTVLDWLLVCAQASGSNLALAAERLARALSPSRWVSTIHHFPCPCVRRSWSASLGRAVASVSSCAILRRTGPFDWWLTTAALTRSLPSPMRLSGCRMRSGSAREPVGSHEAALSSGPLNTDERSSNNLVAELGRASLQPHAPHRCRCTANDARARTDAVRHQ